MSIVNVEEAEFYEKLQKEIDESEEEIEQGKIYTLDEVFREIESKINNYVQEK